MECGRSIVNHVKAFLVKEFGKYFIFKFSLFTISHASIRYQVISSTTDSLVSPTNLMNLGTFQPLGSLVYSIYSNKTDTNLAYVGLYWDRYGLGCFRPHGTNYFALFKLFCWTFLTTPSTIWFLFSSITLGLFWLIYSSCSLCVRGSIDRNPNCGCPWLIRSAKNSILYWICTLGRNRVWLLNEYLNMPSVVVFYNIIHMQQLQLI